MDDEVYYNYVFELVESIRVCLKLGVIDKQKALEDIERHKRRFASLKRLSEIALAELENLRKEVEAWRTVTEYTS